MWSHILNKDISFFCFLCHQYFHIFAFFRISHFRLLKIAAEIQGGSIRNRCVIYGVTNCSCDAVAYLGLNRLIYKEKPVLVEGARHVWAGLCVRDEKARLEKKKKKKETFCKLESVNYLILTMPLLLRFKAFFLFSMTTWYQKHNNAGTTDKQNKDKGTSLTTV